MPEPEGECGTCGEFGKAVFPEPEERCPNSKRDCGHHCNCSWIHDCCHWCGATIGEGGTWTFPEVTEETTT